MSTLLQYSGLTTKIRAMDSHLITDTDYRKISEFASIAEVVSFLKQIPGYAEIFAGLDETNLHRGDVERHLTASIYWGFMRIYHFAAPEQKKFLDLYFERYEIFVIKRYIHMIEDHREYIPKMGRFGAFFRKHSQLDLEKMSACRSVEELILTLKNTVFYDGLSPLLEKGDLNTFDYEMALDMHYFSRIWKQKNRILSGEGLESITRAYGVKFDMLNLDWIYRSKKYYHLSTGDIYAMLIPMHYHLKAQEITAMVECAGVDEFANLLDKTYYAGKYEELSPENIEKMYVEILKHTLTREARNHPYSAAIMYKYLYKKEHEVDRLTTALECIRYHLDAETTYKYICEN